MRPYYDDELVTLLHGDALEVLPTLTAGSIAACVTDPDGHPAQKPVGLVRRILAVAQVDGIVLDPFVGSGTTAVAAKALGLRAIGIEAEERYCEIAARRLAQGVLDFGEATA